MSGRLLLRAFACLAITLFGSAVPSAAHNHYWPGHPHYSPRIVALSDLSFGTIAPDTIRRGVVHVKADRNASSQCTPNLTCLEGGSRAQFKITGRANRFVHVLVPERTVLMNAQGRRMAVSDFEIHAQGLHRGRGFMRNKFAVILGVGAKLYVKPDQPPGNYRGTFEVAVCYE